MNKLNKKWGLKPPFFLLMEIDKLKLEKYKQN